MACGVNNIRIEAINATWGGNDLGLLEGDVELTTEEQSTEITAHQSGPTILDTIRTSNSVEVTLTLKETNTSRLQDLLLAGGATSVAQAEITTITTVADVASSLQNDYFFLWETLDAVKHYFWFNVGGAGVDPAPPGATGHAVAISANATAATVASTLQGVIDALAGFIATVSSNVVTVTNATSGYATDVQNVTTTFTFAVTQQGTPAGLIGWGSSKDQTSMLSDAEKLVLHPVSLATSDQTRDVAIWKAYPMLESLVYSGENPQVASLTFKCFRDCTRPDEVSLFVYGGNHT